MLDQAGEVEHRAGRAAGGLLLVQAVQRLQEEPAVHAQGLDEVPALAGEGVEVDGGDVAHGHSVLRGSCW